MTDLTDHLEDFDRRLRAMERELAELRAIAHPEPVVAPAPIVPPAAAEPPRPRPVTPPPSPRPVQPPREIDWSIFFGAKALAWAGGAVMLLGIVFFFVLAVNRGWIGPVARVTLGSIASALVFGAGFYVKRRFAELYHSALAAVGTGIGGAYMTLLAAKVLYDLVPDWAALLIAAGIASVGVATAVAWSSELIAGLGLIGALLAPAAVGVQAGEVTAAGTGFAALVFAATAIVAVRQRWSRLLVTGVVASLPQVAILVARAEPTEWDVVSAAALFWALYLGAAAGLAGSPRLGEALEADSAAAAAERPPRRGNVRGAVRGPNRRVGDARRRERLRRRRGGTLPGSAAPRPERAPRRDRPRPHRRRPGRAPVRPDACNRLGRRGRRPRLARPADRREALRARRDRVPRRRGRPRAPPRRPADALLRGERPARGRFSRVPGRRLGRRGRRLVRT